MKSMTAIEERIRQGINDLNEARQALGPIPARIKNAAAYVKMAIGYIEKGEMNAALNMLSQAHKDLTEMQ